MNANAQISELMQFLIIYQKELFKSPPKQKKPRAHTQQQIPTQQSAQEPAHSPKKTDTGGLTKQPDIVVPQTRAGLQKSNTYTGDGHVVKRVKREPHSNTVTSRNWRPPTKPKDIASPPTIIPPPPISVIKNNEKSDKPKRSKKLQRAKSSDRKKTNNKGFSLHKKKEVKDQQGKG